MSKQEILSKKSQGKKIEVLVPPHHTNTKISKLEILQHVTPHLHALNIYLVWIWNPLIELDDNKTSKELYSQRNFRSDQ